MMDDGHSFGLYSMISLPSLRIFRPDWIFSCCTQFCLSYSTSPWLFMLESIISKRGLIGNFFVMDRFLYSGSRRWPSLRIFRPDWIFSCCTQFCLSYSTCPWFFVLESIILEKVLIGNFFVMDRFLYSGNRIEPSLRPDWIFSFWRRRPRWSFDRRWPRSCVQGANYG